MPNSSPVESIICMPRQMPRNGRPERANARMGSINPRLRSSSIPSPNAPTPGRMRREADATSPGALVSFAIAPHAESARITLPMLPMP